MIRIRFQPPVGDAAWDKWLNEGQTAADSMVNDPMSPHKIIEALYKRERDRLLQATHNKCAYCEIRVTPGQRKGDVEHYRPKGRVRDRDGKLVKISHQGVMVAAPGLLLARL